jgi:flavin-dependent dehydrogenase
MENDTYGGGFLYHLENNQVTLGFVTGLDYKNPWLSPFEEMQRWKTHPSIKKYLEGGKRLSYGARAITAGGLLSLPKAVFPGGALIGCDAGYLNAARIKGSHAAMKTGMLAADAAYEAVTAGRSGDELTAYPQAFEHSWLVQERLVDRVIDDRYRTLATAAPGHQVAALDDPPQRARSCHTTAGRPVHKNRVSQAGRQDHVRQAFLGLCEQHQP